LAAQYDSTAKYRVLLEKLIVTHLLRHLLASYGTQKFITVFTRATDWLPLLGTCPGPD
jgi:hypothetical protein